MNNTISETLDIHREYRKQRGIKAERKVHRVTANPSTIKPEETFYLTIPKLKNGFVYIPNSIALIFSTSLKKCSRVMLTTRWCSWPWLAISCPSETIL